MSGKETNRREFLAGGTGAAGAITIAAIGVPARAQDARAHSGVEQGVADLVLRNGKVITVNARSAIEQAVAIRGDRIIAVGSNMSMNANLGPGTHVVDLRGRAVIPGLIDGHAHMDREGLKTIFPSLGNVRSIRDIQDRIADLARRAKPGDWIVTMPIGDPPFYLDVPDILSEKRWPNRHDLDRAAPHNPVLIRCIWGFWRTTPPLVTCVNTEALRLAGIDRNTVSPDPGLIIEKDQNGEPAGVFLESDLQPLAELIWFQEATRFSRADRARALPVSAQAYHAYGTTSVFEEHGVANEVLRAYKDVAQKGQLTMRAALVFSPNWKAAGGAPLRSFVEAWAGWLGEPALGDNWVKLSGLYVNIQHRPSDDLRAAAGPYTGWGGYNYDTGLPAARLRELALECARNDIRVIANAGLSPGILDIFEQVDQEFPLNGRRWVLGHVVRLSQKDIERVARMGLLVTPNTNPSIYKFGHTVLKGLPAGAADDYTPLRRLLDAGVTVGLATDNAPVSLFWPIWEATARRSITNELVAPTQAISRMEALRCATIDGARLSFDEAQKGSLEPGKLADLAVLSADPLTSSESTLRDTRSLATIVGGRVVYGSLNFPE